MANKKQKFSESICFPQSPSVSSDKFTSASCTVTIPNIPFCPTGWVCPKCGAVMSPTTSVCIRCTGVSSSSINFPQTQPVNRNGISGTMTTSDSSHMFNYCTAHQAVGADTEVK